MQNTKIYTMPFAKVYPLYIKKVEKKGRSKSEVDQVIFWLTGYDQKPSKSTSINKPTSKPSLQKLHKSTLTPT